jgi:hypothetical protein
MAEYGWAWFSFLNPKLELFTFMTILPTLEKEWGEEGLQDRTEQDFATAAAEKQCMTSRRLWHHLGRYCNRVWKYL